MKHMMLDCYGANRDTCNDLKYIYFILNELAEELKLKPVAPPQLIPYYYGKVAMDDGISAFLLLEGGHITIHTFPFRECYFVDLFSQTDFDEAKVVDLFEHRLSYDKKISFVSCKDRKINSHEQLEYNPSMDFGPHVLIKVQSKEELKLDNVSDFLEHLVPGINMTPITRAFVVKSSVKHPKFLSGIILIAQSHISLHYNYKTKEIFFDIFSCAPFDFNALPEILGQFGEVISNDMVARGTKHTTIIGKDPFNSGKKANRNWQKTASK